MVTEGSVLTYTGRGGFKYVKTLLMRAPFSS